MASEQGNAFEVFAARSEFEPSGFHVTFSNGYTLSVCFGTRNYADDGRTTAEVAVWDAQGQFVRVEGLTTPHDQVAPYVTPEGVAEAFHTVSRAYPGQFAAAKVGLEDLERA